MPTGLSVTPLSPTAMTSAGMKAPTSFAEGLQQSMTLTSQHSRAKRANLTRDGSTLESKKSAAAKLVAQTSTRDADDRGQERFTENLPAYVAGRAVKNPAGAPDGTLRPPQTETSSRNEVAILVSDKLAEASLGPGSQHWQAMNTHLQARTTIRGPHIANNSVSYSLTAAIRSESNSVI